MNRHPHHETPPTASPQRRDPLPGAPDYEDLPSLTNRTGPLTGDDDGFGTPEQGSYGRSDEGDTSAQRRTAAPRSAQRTGKTGDPARPDDSIVDDVTDRLARDEQLEAGEILIMIDAGVLTLTGNVPELAMKQRAEHLVAGVDGVSAVHNRIRVDDGSASFGPPGEAVRSGHGQTGSGFATSDRIGDDTSDDSLGSR